MIIISEYTPPETEEDEHARVIDAFCRSIISAASDRPHHTDPALFHTADGGRGVERRPRDARAIYGLWLGLSTSTDPRPCPDGRAFARRPQAHKACPMLLPAPHI